MAEGDMQELGSSGLKHTGGIVIEEFLPSLVGLRGIRTYREMAENDPVIGSILFAIDKIVSRLDWRIDEGGESPQEIEAAEFVQSCLDDMSDSWNSTVSSILSMLTFGWSYHEVVYKRRQGPLQKDPSKRSRFNDGRIGWRKMPVRAQETLWQWQFDEDGGIQGMIQSDPYGNKGAVTIPIEKSLLFRTTTAKNNPEGRSLLRNAYRAWYFKRRIEEIEAVGIERDLAGLPVAFVPPSYLSSNATAAEQQVLAAVQQIVTSIKRNEQEGVIFPSVYDENGHKTFDLTLMSSGGARQFDTDKVISRYDQRIAMSVLSDFILLGHENVGSFALGASKIDLWSLAVDSIARSIVEVFNAHAIPRLLILNGIQVDNPPVLTYGEVSSVNLAEVADFVSKLAAAGAIMPDSALEQHLRELAALPPAQEDTQGPSGPMIRPSALPGGDESTPDAPVE